MEDILQKILCSLIREQGTSIIHDPEKFRNLLVDYSKGEYKKERKCLSDSLYEGIPEALHVKKDQLDYSILSWQLSEKLIHNLGITPELAKWTVDSWALALGVIRPNDILSREFNLTILSNPSGARVVLNGINAGVTPLNLKTPEQKEYTIEISLDGFEPWIRSQNITSKENFTITANLIKKTIESGSITIETTPPNAEIFLNLKKLGKTPNTIRNLSEGDYEIRIALPGYTDIVVHKQVRRGITIKITESFTSRPVITPVPVQPVRRSWPLLYWCIFLTSLIVIGFFGYNFLSGEYIISVPISLPDGTGGFYQSPISPQQYSKTVGDWQFTLTSTNTYTLAGKVVGRREYPATMPDGIIPLDLAVVNGDLVRYDILSYFTFTMGPGTLKYNYDIPTSTGITVKYIDEHISLTRLVFLDPALENEVKKVKEGDCIIIKGKLVDIRGSSLDKSYEMITSTVRDDYYPTGAEIVLVESFTPGICRS